jgi:hypothetical protein
LFPTNNDPQNPPVSRSSKGKAGSVVIGSKNSDVERRKPTLMRTDLLMAGVGSLRTLLLTKHFAVNF